MLHLGVMPLPEPMMTMPCHWHRISWVRDMVLLSLVQVMPWYVLATMALHEPVMTTPYHWPRIWPGTFLAICLIMEQWYGLVLLMYLNDCDRYITGPGNSMVPPGYHGITWTSDDNTVSLSQDMAWHLLGTMPSWCSDMGWCYWCIWMIVVDTSLVQVIPWLLLGAMALPEQMMTTPYHWPRISWARDMVLLSLVQVMPWYVLATMALHEPVMTTPYRWPRIWHGTFLAPCLIMEQWYGLVLLMYLNDCGWYITVHMYIKGIHLTCLLLFIITITLMA